MQVGTTILIVSSEMVTWSLVTPGIVLCIVVINVPIGVAVTLSGCVDVISRGASEIDVGVAYRVAGAANTMPQAATKVQGINIAINVTIRNAEVLRSEQSMETMNPQIWVSLCHLSRN